MLAAITPPPTFPDDPRKWDGWSKYRAENPYERLCLDHKDGPTDEQIQQHCTALLQWWKAKLPLKNQPSNPLAQLLGRGIDEAPRYLVQARMDLLDPERRQQCDEQLAAQAGQETLEEFAKFIRFSIKNGILTPEAEANLIEFGQNNGIADDEIHACIGGALRLHKARRATPAPIRVEVPAPAPPPAFANGGSTLDFEKEFIRVLQLGSLNMASASYTVRAFLAKIAESLQIAPERGEQLLDGFLEENELHLAKPGPHKPVITLPRKAGSPSSDEVAAREAAAKQIASFVPKLHPVNPRLPANFSNRVGATMVLLPAGEFIMGSDAPDAQPNEQPLTPVSLGEFYISQHPVTNAQFEQFDPRHQLKRNEGGGDDHPVVYVTSFEAAKFCEWLGQRDGKKYRLPTEAEWEYAARGIDGRKYPWGNQEGRGLANFADASTNFPWRDPSINDGYPQSSPVGAYPRGASFFALEDMAGNVWEWCLDFYQDLAGVPKQNPRGPASGPKRLYRGGSWKTRFTNLRASARASNDPNFSCNDLGFRVVCDSE